MGSFLGDLGGLLWLFYSSCGPWFLSWRHLFSICVLVRLDKFSTMNAAGRFRFSTYHRQMWRNTLFDDHLSVSGFAAVELNSFFANLGLWPFSFWAHLSHFQLVIGHRLRGPMFMGDLIWLFLVAMSAHLGLACVLRVIINLCVLDHFEGSTLGKEINLQQSFPSCCPCTVAVTAAGPWWWCGQLYPWVIWGAVGQGRAG